MPRPRIRTAALLAAAALPFAAPAHAADPAHDPTFDCSVYWRYNGVLAWVAHATAPAGHGGVRQLVVTCTYSNESGSYTAWGEAGAPVVAVPGSGLLAAGRMTVCGRAVVFYNDGHSGSAPERCVS